MLKGFQRAAGGCEAAGFDTGHSASRAGSPNADQKKQLLVQPFFLKPVSRWIRLAPIQAMDLMESEMRVFVRSGTGGAWLEGIKESGWYRDEIRP